MEKSKTRGIFEKVVGSGVYWIRYTDGQGKYRREIAGSCSQASKLLSKRRAEALQRKKLPETLRQKTILFNEIADDALAFSKAHKRSYRDDVRVIARLKEWFGAREAELLSSAEIERRLSDAAGENKWAASTYTTFAAPCR
jgi:hypothetical protein